MISDSFGSKHAAAIYGACMIFLGLSSVCFNKLSTLINASGAATGNYTATFIMAAVNCILPILFMVWYGKLNKREHIAAYAYGAGRETGTPIICFPTSFLYRTRER